jgi:hypothetical protein
MQTSSVNDPPSPTRVPEVWKVRTASWRLLSYFSSFPHMGGTGGYLRRPLLQAALTAVPLAHPRQPGERR